MEEKELQPILLAILPCQMKAQFAKLGDLHFSLALGQCADPKGWSSWSAAAAAEAPSG
jgi:hypothetical protein